MKLKLSDFKEILGCRDLMNENDTFRIKMLGQEFIIHCNQTGTCQFTIKEVGDKYPVLSPQWMRADSGPFGTDSFLLYFIGKGVIESDFFQVQFDENREFDGRESPCNLQSGEGQLSYIYSKDGQKVIGCKVIFTLSKCADGDDLIQVWRIPDSVPGNTASYTNRMSRLKDGLNLPDLEIEVSTSDLSKMMPRELFEIEDYTVEEFIQNEDWKNFNNSFEQKIPNQIQRAQELEKHSVDQLDDYYKISHFFDEDPYSDEHWAMFGELLTYQLINKWVRSPKLDDDDMLENKYGVRWISSSVEGFEDALLECIPNLRKEIERAWIRWLKTVDLEEYIQHSDDPDNCETDLVIDFTKSKYFEMLVDDFEDDHTEMAISVYRTLCTINHSNLIIDSPKFNKYLIPDLGGAEFIKQSSEDEDDWDDEE